MNHAALWLGITEYTQAWRTQQEHHQQVRRGLPGTVLGCEHFPVVTCGRRSKLLEPATIHSRSEMVVVGGTPHRIPIVQTNRGGLMTIHNPGQLVIYPIFSLRGLGLGVREWVQCLLEVTTLTLKKCNIILIDHNTGLHTQTGKIASLGIMISKGVNLHGIAINVSNELEIFRAIAPCGMAGQKMDRVSNHDLRISTEMLFEIWCDSFNTLTGSTIVNTKYSSSIGSLGAVGSAFP